MQDLQFLATSPYCNPGFHLGGSGGRLSPLGILLPPLEIVLLKFIIDVDKGLAKCMSSERMHM